MESLCPQKERCGSCGWSHIPYEKQLQQKLSDINGSFKLKGLTDRVEDIAPSPELTHYRNRMDFVIDFEGRFGMREKGKWWKVIDGHHCFLGMSEIDRLFDIVRAWLPTSELAYYDRKANTGVLRYAVIRTTTLGQSMVIIVTSATEGTEAEQLQSALKTLSSKVSSDNVSLIHSINHTISDVSFGDELHTISGTGFIEEKINGLLYRITPNAFFQTNPYGASMLLDTVREFSDDLSDKTLLDLYCGSGFFAIGLAHEAKRTIGVELVADAIRDAEVNAKQNDVEVEFHEAKTEDFDWGQYEANVVILDPPRSGMHDKALADVLRIQPEKIVYVSCNYKNFARELVKLKEIYNVEAMRAVDMFPHTPHVELVTRLVKKHLSPQPKV